MLNKDFENFELRLKTLREESREDFDRAENMFKENYSQKLEEIFPRDILWAKKSIAGKFIVNYVDNPEKNNIFEKVVSDTIQTLPLSKERQNSLIENILRASELWESLHTQFWDKTDISRDPFFALVEDFSLDGDISREEFVILQQSYQQEGDFLKALESLPAGIRDIFHSHIALTLSNQENEKRWEFESEFSQELHDLKNKGINIEPVAVFVSKSYYKTPGKYRKYEHPKRRMRRTFKIALLRLLRAKLWNIDAKIMLERFEQGESFEDFFMLLFKLLEVVNENPNSQEVFNILKLDEDIQDEVFTAEENKQKILAWESLVMRIASLFSKSDANVDEQELWEWMLEKILDDTTDIVWEDVYFNREDENAGIYANQTSLPPFPWQGEGDNEEEEGINYDNMSPEVAYEMLKKQFHDTEDKKRNAFWEGRYDDIDIYNDSLLNIQSKLEKLSKLLGEV